MKLRNDYINIKINGVLITYPLKQGLKPWFGRKISNITMLGSNYLSTKTRIETQTHKTTRIELIVLITYPLKQGLKL
ncbi:hypothetical protein GMMP15_1900017 [Candidatus Magnetomoraceae bacterium gMMP-15]